MFTPSELDCLPHHQKFITACTMLLVNHNMSTIPGLATRCMLLESGRLAAMGESQAIIQRDQQSSHDAAMGRVALEGGAS